MTNTTLNLQTASGHQVLAAAGKKYLRPGGRIATETLLQWANFQPGATVLELASSFGYSAIYLVQHYNVKVLGIEKNPESVAKACANIRAAGLENQIKIIQGDIFHLDDTLVQFDYVLAEAILTMQSPVGKTKLLTEIHKRLKLGGKFLSHELLARDKEAEIHSDLARVIKVNSTPLSENNWIDAFATSGLKIAKHQTGSMNLLNLKQILQDEGFFNTLQIFWNVLTQTSIRKRVLEMHRIFHQYHDELGYIILCAVAN
ncbi:class I SAM-dependent methyltransferase [Anabaena sp. UHCC 0399]|uniref:class I SAM-dependent methyltransferase n=1 Tax=Anabaena sp. UHCC 0399 TaxID=3110238 RepID=UPI002B20CD18|nr:class I SAM-dependent methyltransferase [Anabaena sp. UHCC 0399]MEA5568241.1 class I SAM-dependent methyltransferase [Anabaena sp. UHCC 0399]